MRLTSLPKICLFFAFCSNVKLIYGRVCSDDTAACINDQLYTFYVCPFLKAQGDCTEDVSQSFMTGTFVRDDDSLDGIFTDGDLEFTFTENCYDFEMPTVGFVGSLSMDSSVDPPVCYGIYGTMYVGGSEYGQFVGEYIEPTPMPTPSPTAAPTAISTSSVADECDYEQLSLELSCDDFSDCHRGNWTFIFCDYDCDTDENTACKTSLSDEEWTDVTLDWGDGILIDGDYYEYEIDCRKWSVPEMKMEGYFMSESNDEDYCNSMSVGTWSGGIFKATKTADLSSDSSSSGIDGMQLAIAIVGAVALAIVAIMLYMLFKKWKGGGYSNKAISSEVYEIPRLPAQNIPPPYIPYQSTSADPFSLAPNPSSNQYMYPPTNDPPPNFQHVGDSGFNRTAGPNQNY